jgi:hypothetical protein
MAVFVSSGEGAERMRSMWVTFVLLALLFGLLVGCIPTVADVQGHPLPHNAAQWRE